MENGVSIVICCYNSEDRLPNTLCHLLKQQNTTDIKWEVCIIDNASSDNTAQVSRDLWANSDIPLNVYPESKPGLANARIKGFESARYSIVSFVDDDNWVAPDWIYRIYTLMLQNPKIGAVGGRGEGVFDCDVPVWFDKFQGAYAVGPQGNERGFVERSLFGAGFCIRKSIWEHLKDSNFKLLLSGRTGGNLNSGGDSEICWGLRLAGYKLYYDPELRYKHYIPASRLTWGYARKLFKEFGKSWEIKIASALAAS